jgi:hypothetical protein
MVISTVVAPLRWSRGNTLQHGALCRMGLQPHCVRGRVEHDARPSPLGCVQEHSSVRGIPTRNTRGKQAAAFRFGYAVESALTNGRRPTMLWCRGQGQPGFQLTCIARAAMPIISHARLQRGEAFISTNALGWNRSRHYEYGRAYPSLRHHSTSTVGPTPPYV